MAETYQHLTNITSEQVNHTRTVLENMDVDYKIVPMEEGAYSAYVDGSLSDEEMGAYFENSLRLSVIIEIAMVDSGYAEKGEVGFGEGKIPPTLGSEDVYRPERADTQKRQK